MGEPLATITLDLNDGGKPIPPYFFGFSHEWNHMFPLCSAPVNDAFFVLLNNLRSFGNEPVHIRIGGNSADDFLTFIPEPGQWQAVGACHQQTGARFALNLNASQNNPKLTSDQALSGCMILPPGSIDFISFGNEPDCFGGDAGRAGRSKNWSCGDFCDEWNQLASAVIPVLDQYPQHAAVLAGPESKAFCKEFTERCISSGRVAVLTAHYYAMSGKFDCPLPDFASAAKLRRIAAVPALKGELTLAQSRGLKMRISEMNTVSMGGKPGISDAFVSALWVLVENFIAADAGFEGVNWHGCGVVDNLTGRSRPASYSAFTFVTKLEPGRTVLLVHAPYYGHLLFRMATGNQASIIKHTDVIHPANKPLVEVWAVKDKDRNLRVVVANFSQDTGGMVSVKAPGYGAGNVAYLMSPGGLLALNGITVANQTFDGSQDGKPIGDYQESNVAPDGDGNYLFFLPPSSGALLKIQAI